MDVIMALLTNITRDMEVIKKTLERLNDNGKFGTLSKKVEVRAKKGVLSFCISND